MVGTVPATRRHLRHIWRLSPALPRAGSLSSPRARSELHATRKPHVDVQHRLGSYIRSAHTPWSMCCCGRTGRKSREITRERSCGPRPHSPRVLSGWLYSADDHPRTPGHQLCPLDLCVALRGRLAAPPHGSRGRASMPCVLRPQPLPNPLHCLQRVPRLAIQPHSLATQRPGGSCALAMRRPRAPRFGQRASRGVR